MKKIFLLLLLSLSFNVLSQNPGFTILCVAAHPDDEDGATLAYYSKIKGYRAYTVFYTRGEGGQNEIGPELNKELGKIREQECFDAAEIQGSKPYFLGELDFGFSKTAKETFKFWGGEDSVLARIVYMIRVLRPDVVISNHDTITTKPNRQHGNHQAVGITIYEAFDKAADPNYHPEQLERGVQPWQIKKLYFRVFDTTKTDVFEIDVSEKDASGRTIREISADALAKHKTQGMDKIDKSSPFFFGDRKYELIRSDKMYPVEGDDLFAGVEPSRNIIMDVLLRSYDTYYSYKTVNPKDSLRILKSLKYAKDIKIGLVKTYDNTIKNVLKAFNIPYDTLTPEIIESGQLLGYTSIILDLRAYFYRPDVIKNNQRLLKYAEDGRNLIVFYNKPQDWNGKGELAPYPIYITSERVTEEDAPIIILEPKHDFFNKPNKIMPGDWAAWVQERNVYLPSDDTTLTTNRYQRLLEMNDENDSVPSTSILFAKYGAGTYTYCALAMYRQLKIFHEGALKVFMNMISQKTSLQRLLDNNR